MARVILSTSDFMETWNDPTVSIEATEKIGTFEVRGETLHVFSRGVLEKALAAGHEVIIATTRQDTRSPTDAWWRKLVPEDHIFWADGEDYTSGWKSAFQALDIPWPTYADLFGGDLGPGSDEPASVDAAMCLLAKHGVLQARNI